MKVEMNNNSNMGYVSTERMETKKVDMPKVIPEERVNKEAKSKETSERDAQKIKETVEKLKKKIEKGDALSSNISVNLGEGGNIGGYKTGDIINEGTSLEEIIKSLLTDESYSDDTSLRWIKLGGE